MTPQRRSEYVQYMAGGLRYIKQITEHEAPDDTIIICKSYCELAELDEILGMPIYVSNIPSPFNFFIAFKSKNPTQAKAQAVFLEYMETYELGDVV